MNPNLQLLGLKSRWNRLAFGKSINLVALDHGISLGWTMEQDPPEEIAQNCIELGIHGVVCHIGLIDRIGSKVPIFLQLMGNSPGDVGNKAILATVKSAIIADCVGIAVEYNSNKNSELMAQASLLAHEARQLGLITMIMGNYDPDCYEAFGKTIVGASQIGGDLIKIRIPDSDPSKDEIGQLRRIISSSPPIVVSGGDSSTNLLRKLKIASSLGFSGSCIGRHYFNNTNRENVIREVRSIFL